VELGPGIIINEFDIDNDNWLASYLILELRPGGVWACCMLDHLTSCSPGENYLIEDRDIFMGKTSYWRKGGYYA